MPFACKKKKKRERRKSTQSNIFQFSDDDSTWICTTCFMNEKLFLGCERGEQERERKTHRWKVPRGSVVDDDGEMMTMTALICGKEVRESANIITFQREHAHLHAGCDEDPHLTRSLFLSRISTKIDNMEFSSCKIFAERENEREEKCESFFSPSRKSSQILRIALPLLCLCSLLLDSGCVKWVRTRRREGKKN